MKLMEMLANASENTESVLTSRTPQVEILAAPIDGREIYLNTSTSASIFDRRPPPPTYRPLVPDYQKPRGLFPQLDRGNGKTGSQAREIHHYHTVERVVRVASSPMTYFGAAAIVGGVASFLGAVKEVATSWPLIPVLLTHGLTWATLPAAAALLILGLVSVALILRLRRNKAEVAA